MRTPNPLLLLRIAQGDALGAACEHVELPRDQAVLDAALRFDGYGAHPWHDLPAGRYTDDTQMSIAVAEVLLGPEPFTREAFADAFVACFKRDERAGYARGFQAFLEEVQSGAELLARIRSASDKNGAAMRSVPLGVLARPALVREVATVQARITHDTEGGVNASVAVALMSHHALWIDAPLADVRPWLQAQMPAAAIPDTPWSGDPVEGPDLGWKTALAVLTLVERAPTLLDLARTALRWGGDTDSVLAIAWGIASTRLVEPLPAFFEDDLEDGAYGRAFLRTLGAALMKKYAPGP